MRSPSLRLSRTATNWATISHANKWRLSPIRPVAQNTQPMAQPTCEDRHTVKQPGLSRGIFTHSTKAPSSRRIKNFSKPSASSVTRSCTLRRSRRVKRSRAFRTVVRTGFFMASRSCLPSEITRPNRRLASANLQSTPLAPSKAASWGARSPNRCGRGSAAGAAVPPLSFTIGNDPAEATPKNVTRSPFFSV